MKLLVWTFKLFKSRTVKVAKFLLFKDKGHSITGAKMLSSDYNMKLILEEFADNPFLPNFYKNPDNNAFPLELILMAERYHQLKNMQEQDLFQPSLISDYFFIVYYYFYVKVAMWNWKTLLM